MVEMIGVYLKLSLTIKIYPYCISFVELGYSLIPKQNDWKLKWNDSLLDYFEEDDMTPDLFTRRKYLKMMKDYYKLFERMKK